MKQMKFNYIQKIFSVLTIQDSKHTLIIKYKVNPIFPHVHRLSLPKNNQDTTIFMHESNIRTEIEIMILNKYLSIPITFDCHICKC